MNFIFFIKNFEGLEICEMGRVCNLVYKGFVKKNVDIFFFLNFDEIFSFVEND